MKKCEIERRAKAESRPLTEEERQAVESYNDSNKARYKADTLRLRMYEVACAGIKRQMQEQKKKASLKLVAA